MFKQSKSAHRGLAAGFVVLLALSLAPLGAAAHGWYRSGGYYSYGGGCHHCYRHGHGGYWSGGRWVAGALIAGATAGLVTTALSPGPSVVYAAPPTQVIYAAPVPTTTVIYENAPVQRTVTTTTTTYYGN